MDRSALVPVLTIDLESSIHRHKTSVGCRAANTNLFRTQPYAPEHHIRAILVVVLGEVRGNTRTTKTRYLCPIGRRPYGFFVHYSSSPTLIGEPQGARVHFFKGMERRRRLL